METKQIEIKRDKNFDRDIKEIELNIMVILSRAERLHNQGKRTMSKDERWQLKFLNNKYPSESFFLFNIQDGFFDGLPEYEELKRRVN